MVHSVHIMHSMALQLGQTGAFVLSGVGRGERGWKCRMGVGCLHGVAGQDAAMDREVEQRRKSALHDDESGAALRRVKRQVG